MMCVGGPCAYRLKEGVPVTDDWLFEYVIPNIRKRFEHDTRLCRVLGNALLYSIFKDELADKLPVALVARVKTAYALLENNPVEGNPVKKVPLHIYNVGGELRIREVIAIDDDDDARQPQAATTGVGAMDAAGQRVGGVVGGEAGQIMSVFEQFRQDLQLWQQRQEQTITNLRSSMEQRLSTVNNNVRRFGGTIQGGFVRQDRRRQLRIDQMDDANEANQEGPGAATLAPTPRTLMELWEEWTVGIGERKPASQFTMQERNHKLWKQKYYRRKHVWDVIAEHVRAGSTAVSAIHKIRSALGYRDSVTQIINKLIYWKKQGGHPNLRI